MGDQQAQLSNLDEWGRCNVEEYDLVDLHREGVIQAIRDNNHAITAVYASGYPLDGGQSLGQSTVVKHLELNFCSSDVEDVREFCQGVSENKSIQSLNIRCVFDEEVDEDLINAVFEPLFPLFQNNKKLEVLDFRWEADEGDRWTVCPSVLKAVEACAHLKSLSIKGYENVLGVIDVGIIAKRPELEHMEIDNCVLRKKDCEAIRELLSGGNSGLKSLVLSSVQTNNANVEMIADGLRRNNCLQCFSYRLGLYEKAIGYLLEPLQHVQLNSLEKVEFVSSYTLYGSCFSLISGAVEQMPMLTSLKVKGLILSVLDWEQLFSALFRTSSALCELDVTFERHHDSVLPKLSACFVRSKSLKILKVACHNRESAATEVRCSFITSMETMNLETLHLSGIVKNDASLAAMSSCLKSIRTLKELEFGGDKSIPANNWRVLADHVKSHPALEGFSFGGSINGVECLASAISMNSRIKQAHLHFESIDQFENIANALSSPSCSIEKLHITYIPNENVLGRSRLSQMMVQLLQRNSSLQVLHFFRCWKQYFEFEFDWSMFTQLLCNTSTIESTYLSNHTLRAIVRFCRHNHASVELCSLMDLNRETNKLVVAREKILRNHNLDDVDFVPSSIPLVLSVLGNTNSACGLLRLYEFLRAKPEIARSQNDQKNHNVEGAK